MASGKYEYWLSPDGLTLLTAWARDGLTDEQISKALNNAYSNLLSTIQQGVNDHAEH